jgi:hypothetical protein
MNAISQSAIRQPIWTSLAYVLPAVVFAAIAFCWCVYCFLAPQGTVDLIWAQDHVPEEAVCEPWGIDPDTGTENRRCYVDQPFHRYTILEPRQRELRKHVWGDAKWRPIVLATIAGILIYCVAWNLWVRLLRNLATH